MLSDAPLTLDGKFRRAPNERRGRAKYRPTLTKTEKSNRTNHVSWRTHERIAPLTRSSPCEDYRHGAKTQSMALEAGEFIRRFLLHTLPDGFHRIRHYGFLANGARTERLARCRRLLNLSTMPDEATIADEHGGGDRKLTWRDFAICPDCGGAMQRIAIVPRSPPPPFRCDTS